MKNMRKEFGFHFKKSSLLSYILILFVLWLLSLSTFRLSSYNLRKVDNVVFYSSNVKNFREYLKEETLFTWWVHISEQLLAVKNYFPHNKLYLPLIVLFTNFIPLSLIYIVSCKAKLKYLYLYFFICFALYIIYTITPIFMFILHTKLAP